MSSHIAQKEVERILSGIEAVLFGNGKDIHFKKYEDFHTIATKSTTNGICFYDLDHGIDHTPKRYHPCYRTGVRLMGVDIPVKKPAKPDDYMKEALSHLDKLSYCMISREMFSSGWRSLCTA